MTIARLASARGLLVGLAAAAAGAAALAEPASVLRTALWPLTVLAACHGYGRALERATGQRAGLAATTIAGLAVLVTISVVLGQLGVLTRGVELGALGLGLVCGGLAPVARDRGGPPLAAVAGAAAVVVGLAAVAIARVELLIMDGINHTFIIKQLWDTGGLDQLPHQLGGQPVAASYFALAPGAWAVMVLEGSAAPVLVAALLIERLAALGSRAALAVAFVLAIPIVLLPDLTSQWSAVALLAAAWFALFDAAGRGRTAWGAIASALALAVTRHEYALLAPPLVAAALVLPRPAPPSRRAAIALAAGWIAVLVGLQVALAVPVVRAIVNAGLLLAAWPLARAVLAAAGAPARGALAVLAGTSISFGLALALDAIRPAQHHEAASFAVWFAAAACVAALPAWYGEPARREALQPLVGVALLALFVGGISIAPSFDGPRRGKLTKYFSDALVTIKYRRATGDGLGPHRDLRALQEHVPAGATIGFWGQSAGALDFRRNPIADRSWPPNRHREELYLTPLELRGLRGRDYMLVEHVAPVETASVPWDLARATVYVEGALERLACVERACVYAVQR